MFKKIVPAILGLWLLTGCADNFREYFKKYANNKLVDAKGFEGGKRVPLYNKKYIAAAKRNIVEENFDDEEEDLLSEYDNETVNPTLRNRKMYLKIIKQDAELNKVRQQANDQKSNSSLLAEANNKVKKSTSNNSNIQLLRELEQLKSLLNETKKDLESYKCPGDILQSKNTENSEIILPQKLQLEEIEKSNKIE